MEEQQRRNAAAHDDDADDDADDAADDDSGDDPSDDSDDDADDGDADDTDDSDHLSPGERSYLNAKMALDYRKRRRKVFVSDPPSVSGKRRGLDSAPTADEAVKAGREAYAKRSQWLNDAWKQNRQRRSGPWLRGDSSPSNNVRAPDKVDHAVLQKAYGARRQTSDGEAAWKKMVNRLENAWKDHRKPFVPPLAEEEGS